MSELMKGQAAPRGIDRSYSQPIKWKDWEERFHSPPPYKTPTEEFRQNRYIPTMDDLLFRWDGIEGATVEIYRLFNDPVEILERQKAQQVRRREMGVPDFTDPVDVRIDTYWDLQIVQARIDALSEQLDTGYETIVEVSGSLMEGFDRQEVRRKISPTSMSLKENSLRKFIELKRLLREQATSIQEVRPGAGKTLRDELRAALSDINHTAGGYSWDEIQAAKTAPQLAAPSVEVFEVPETVEGEVVQVGNH